MPQPNVKRVRTCVGCSVQSGKADLKRIVKKPDGTLAFDDSGRQPGRGAYVCSLACLQSALKARRLERALKTAIGKDDAERIVAQAAAAFGADMG